MSEYWKSLFKEINQTLSPSYGGARLVYIYYDGEIIGVRKQRQSPDGKWEDEQRLSFIQFIGRGYPFMDEEDRTIALILREFNQDRERSPYRNDGEAAMPLLIGTDLVFDPTGKQINVFEEKPSVTFYVKEDQLGVFSNVDFTDGSAHPCKVFTDENGDCHVIHLDRKLITIMEQLYKMDGMPLTEAGGIIELAERLIPLVDADVSSLKQLSSAVDVAGNEKIRVSIRLEGTKPPFYRIILEALPHDKVKSSLYPGEGSQDLLVVDDGRCLKVHRNLEAEKANMESLETEITKLSTAKKCFGWAIDDPGELLQLLEYLHERPDSYAVRCHDIKFIGRASQGTWEIGMTSSIDWFGVEGTLNFGDISIPLKKVLNADLTGEGEYIQLGEKEYLRISKTLKRQLAALRELGEGENLMVPRYRAGRLAEVLGMGELPIIHNDAFEHQVALIKEAYEMEPEVPDGLEASLRDYQIEGYRWMYRLSHWGAGGCLADDMGLGKTVQTIAFLLSQKDKGPSLVIAPTSVVPGWKSELERFAPGLKPHIINNEKERKLTIDHATAGNVVISSYGILTASPELLQRREWNVIILDEAHQIKNRWTKVSKAAMDLRSASRFILTGTPVQNSLGDLWNLFQFINPGLLGQYENFKVKYTAADEDESRQRLEMLKSATQPFILRRTKESVLKDLPRKTELDYLVSLSSGEMAYYEDMRSEIEDIVKLQGESPGNMDISVFEGLTRLRMACCSPGLQNPRWNGGSSKLDELRFLLEHLLKEDTHLLLFSQFTSYLGMVKEMLNQIQVPFLYLDGTTPLKERARLVEQFQNGKCRLFLISLKAGGLGLNLTAANCVILLDPWWNPSIEEQAIDRSYRIGQDRDVMVLRLIAAHTIEEKIIRLQEIKRDISDHVLEGTADSGKLTYQEVMDLVKPF